MSTKIGGLNPRCFSAASTAAIKLRVVVPHPQKPQENRDKCFTRSPAQAMRRRVWLYRALVSLVNSGPLAAQFAQQPMAVPSRVRGSLCMRPVRGVRLFQTPQASRRERRQQHCHPRRGEASSGETRYVRRELQEQIHSRWCIVQLRSWRPACLARPPPTADRRNPELLLSCGVDRAPPIEFANTTPPQKGVLEDGGVGGAGSRRRRTDSGTRSRASCCRQAFPTRSSPN